MIDHIGIDVTDLATAKAFYVKALAPLGIEIVMEVPAEQTAAGLLLQWEIWVSHSSAMVRGARPQAPFIWL